MKILDMKYDKGTMSAPVFLDLLIEQPGGKTARRVTLSGKQARAAKAKYEIGDNYEETY